jgi:dihydrofolate reductase
MESIYAVDSNNGLSKNGTIPWKSKSDMEFFMHKTINNVVIMGKNTFFSIPKEHRPLKNRLNIVLTNDYKLWGDIYEDNDDFNNNVIITDNSNIYQDILNNRNKYNEIHSCLKKDFSVFIIGGKSIYNQFIPLCNKVWVTYIKHDYNCDLFMEYDYSNEYTFKIYKEDDELKIVEYTKN